MRHAHIAIVRHAQVTNNILDIDTLSSFQACALPVSRYGGTLGKSESPGSEWGLTGRNGLPPGPGKGRGV